MTKTISLFGIPALVVVVQAMLGGHVGQLLNVTSLIGVCGLTLLFSVRQVGTRVTMRALLANVIELPHAQGEFDGFNAEIGSSALLSANIMAVLGLIHVMSVLNDPAVIGPAVALAFLSYVYGALLAGILPVGRSKKAQRLTNGQLLVPAAMLATIFRAIMFAIQKH